MENIIFAAMMGMIAGLLCSLAPLIAAVNKGKETFGVVSVIVCALCGAAGGVILALPISLALFAVALVSKDKDGSNG